MTVISLKDYAKQHNITYEAVRQQVARYREELGEHILVDGRQQLLDEAAVAFLDARREKNPVVVMQQDKDERIDELEKENKLLLKKITVLQEDLLNEKNEKLELSEKIANVKLLEARANEAEAVNQALLDQANKAKADAEAAEKKTAEFKAKYEKFEAAMEEYSKLPAWKRLFVKPPKVDKE